MERTRQSELWVLRPDGEVELSSRSEQSDPPRWVPRVLEALRDAATDEVELEEREVSLLAWRLSRGGAGIGPRTLVFVRPRPAWLELAALSGRQREVCEYAASGATVLEIAAHLGISAHTVRTHLKAAYAILGVSNRVELAQALVGRRVASAAE